ncbi:conserved hypothetical protein [Talaromyces stipitatus ATCC 10500]|nr:uncharacterized protein TSTA_041780 [Talaromyces stipitatus ATCC 10500]EED14702.1 conserved hypothetical protein [Talaromyces stipitatus ATCC 10500]
MYKSVLSLGLIASTALAQSVSIGLPAAGAQLSTGTPTTFQIQRPDTLTGSQEIAVVIGISKCNSGGRCASPDESMGTVLYNGPFNPQFHETALPPYQNFTLEIPESAATDNGLVTVAHFSLVGASAWPMVEYLNQSITVA